jgi:hypothetical protein
MLAKARVKLVEQQEATDLKVKPTIVTAGTRRSEQRPNAELFVRGVAHFRASSPAKTNVTMTASGIEHGNNVGYSAISGLVASAAVENCIFPALEVKAHACGIAKATRSLILTQQRTIRRLAGLSQGAHAVGGASMTENMRLGSKTKKTVSS